MIPVLGEIFVGALKAIEPVLVFVLVIASLANASAGIGKRFRTVVIFYMVSTFLAAVMAVISSYLFPVTIPLGATINMDGAAITITVLSLSAAFSQGVKVNVLLAILLSFVATLGACGASGVAGGSLLLIPMACSLLGVNQDIAMQMVGGGFIIGVVQDSLETAINSSGDVIFCATAEFREKLKKGEKVSF